MTDTHDQTTFSHLRERGHRLTPQRLAILQILKDDGGHLSPAEIFERAVKRMPGLTETTVYRTLDFLAQNGLVLIAHVGDGRLVYEISSHNHHHLICHECGTTIEIEPYFLETVYNQVREKTGFTIDQWHVTFFGVCPGCAQASQSKGDK
jgi:Fur family transcriptional regulator, ferric uptake regulator